MQGELCPASNYCDLLLGLMGGLLAVLVVVGGVAYRNWRYEQELDSLLWKIDSKELMMEDAETFAGGTEEGQGGTLGGGATEAARGRNSQISLASNENEFRSVF